MQSPGWKVDPRPVDLFPCHAEVGTQLVVVRTASQAVHELGRQVRQEPGRDAVHGLKVGPEAYTQTPPQACKLLDRKEPRGRSTTLR